MLNFQNVPQIEDYNELYISKSELDFWTSSSRVVGVMDSALNFVFLTDSKIERGIVTIKGVQFKVEVIEKSSWAKLVKGVSI